MDTLSPRLLPIAILFAWLERRYLVQDLMLGAVK
jgi:hypothetical protein